MNFIKKNWQKDATKQLIKVGCRGVGGIGGAFVANKLMKSDNANTNTTLKNISGPVVLGIGTLGSMMLEQPELAAVCEGMATYGMMRTLAVLSPNIGTATGISGLEEDEAAMFGLGANNDEEEVVYIDEQGNQVNPDGTAISAPDDEEADAAMFGLGSDENSTADTLPEFADGGKAQNDGNPWAQVADQIDVDGGVETSTNGIGDAEAASMF